MSKNLPHQNRTLKFTKMHGLGNDFMVLDAVRQRFKLDSATIKRLADRHFGVGFDQLLLVEPSSLDGVDFRYRIFNADGFEVEQCGNGARCFAKFVREQSLSAKDWLVVETNSGIIKLQILSDGLVAVDMGVPILEPARIPFVADQSALTYALEINGEKYTIGVVSMGNPHAVLEVGDVAQAPVATLGPIIENDSHFPARVNVGFMQVVNRGRILLRVFERGVGETLACGTGACAAMVVGRLWDRLADDVCVALPGGELQIRWTGPGEPVTMTGPAETVYTGQIEL